MIKVTLLGTGAARPDVKRNSPANLIEIAGKKFLVDCGSGCIHQMMSAAGGGR